MNILRNISLAALFAVCGCISAAAQPAEKQTLVYGDTTRTYRMYLPQGIRQGAPLVVYTHGYGDKHRWLDDLNRVSDKYGFAICYPDGAPDDLGVEGWFVGYPPQWHMPKNEEDFF